MENSHAITDRVLEISDILKTKLGLSYGKISLRVSRDNNPRYITQRRSNRKKNMNEGISDGVINKFISEFGVNREYIYTGKGDMFVSGTNGQSLNGNTALSALLKSSANTSGYPYVVMLPFIPITAYMTFTESFAQNNTSALEMKPFLVLDDIDTTGCFLLQAEGDSMSPLIMHKSNVLVRPVTDKALLMPGVYAVSIGDMFVVKRIKTNNMAVTGTLELCSDNPNGGSMVLSSDHIDRAYFFKCLSATNSL